jgi:RNA polymerase sigma-70 factor (ECF subfamily)
MKPVRGRHRRFEDELRRVYREHVGAVFAFFAYSVSREAAEDLTGSTFERVVRSWSSFDASRGSERTWILTIARNQLTDFFRREGVRPTVSSDQHPQLLDLLEGGEDPLERRLGIEELKGWLSHLTAREQEVLALRYGADLQAAEIGELCDLSTANVHQILSRSLRRLREQSREPAG